jgi:hypothetical protein
MDRVAGGEGGQDAAERASRMEQQAINNAHGEIKQAAAVAQAMERADPDMAPEAAKAAERVRRIRGGGNGGEGGEGI